MTPDLARQAVRQAVRDLAFNGMQRKGWATCAANYAKIASAPHRSIEEAAQYGALAGRCYADARGCADEIERITQELMPCPGRRRPRRRAA